jgi:malate dehydrogenase (oxaloacetate-decarboxylating)
MGTSIVVRLVLEKPTASFGAAASSIAQAGGDVVAIDVISSTATHSIRDVTIDVAIGRVEDVVSVLRTLDGVRVMHVSDRTFLVHLGGKLTVQPRMRIANREDLSRVYTPGVARVCAAIAEDASKAYALTIKRNTVAIVTDGSAVLGLGALGPLAALPVMEGKAMLFQQLAGVDAFPICLDTTDVDEIVDVVARIAPTFGGINMEDIAAPRCFAIEQRLQQRLDIPVFHDDQHGTAVVMLAGLYNALAVVNKRITNIRAVLIGCGAAGTACADMLIEAGIGTLICCDRHGTLRADVTYDDPNWNALAARTNPECVQSLSDALSGADVCIGVSSAHVLDVALLQKMATDPIVFALANPEPEIAPHIAEPYVRVLATGRGDYPNQINNVLCFPGLFRGVLDCRAQTINSAMKHAAARALASVVAPHERNESYIIPSPFDERVVPAISDAVVHAAIATGVARKNPRRTP